MKSHRKIIFIGISLTVFILAATSTEYGGGSISVSSKVVCVLSALLGIVALALARLEIQKRIRCIFLNFGTFFLLNGIFIPLSTLAWMTQILHGEWLPFYIHQYYAIVYFVILSFSVIFLVLERVYAEPKIAQLYLLSILMAGSVALGLFMPYVLNPKYSYTTSDVRDFKTIREALNKLQKDGIDKPTVRQIAEYVQFDLTQGPEVETSKVTVDARVQELLPFLHGGDYGLLINRPFWMACFLMSLLNLPFIVSFIVHQYLRDPPGGAYIEKMVWCLFIYCLFEAFHFYSYTRANEWQEFVNLENLGHYLSASAIMTMIFLLSLRISFLTSIEGRYYEQKLAIAPTHITRWRDGLDNWVLRQFMNPDELDQRFAVQAKKSLEHKSSEKEES